MTDDTTAAAAEEYLTRHLCDDAIFLYGHQVLGAFEAGAAYGRGEAQEIAKQAKREALEWVLKLTAERVPCGFGNMLVRPLNEHEIRKQIEQQLAGGLVDENRETRAWTTKRESN